MIEHHCSVDEIKHFILQCKHKTGGMIFESSSLAGHYGNSYGGLNKED
ncbi:hypothetical protein NIES19_60930 (plasmid) [Anabaena cylindrica PCC 7122]|nr:hypothetical protein NIES19_60930 [Anabaena cylindrica PCC 7122]